MNTWNLCSFSFPVVFWLFFCVSLGSAQTKNLPGKVLCLFWNRRLDTEFSLWVSILFLTLFWRAGSIVRSEAGGGELPRARAGYDGMRCLLGVAGAPPSKKHGNRGADCGLR
jgi:hypothetical protein